MNTMNRIMVLFVALSLAGRSLSQDGTGADGAYDSLGTALERNRAMAFRDVHGMEPYYEAVGQDRARIVKARPEVLLIPNAQVEAETLRALREDLRVMSHILDTCVQGHTGTASYNRLLSGFDDFFAQHPQKTEVIYVEGYAVLFLRSVDFPLAPSTPSAQDRVDADQGDVDETWERARREILFPGRRRLQAEPTPAYDAERLESLKTELVGALKHAHNIRHVKAHEWIIVALSSGTLEFGTSQVRRMQSGMDNMPGGGVSFGGGISVGGGAGGAYVTGNGPASTSTLCIRAKQTDIAAFARKELDLNAFRAKVQILMY